MRKGRRRSRLRRRAERAATVLFALLLLEGCSAGRGPSRSPTASPDEPPSRLPTPTGKCIFLDTINDWKAVDPYQLLLRTRASGWQWEITLDRRCSDILFADALRWDTPDTRVCAYRTDAIVVRRDRCRIGSIQPYQEAVEP